MLARVPGLTSLALALLAGVLAAGCPDCRQQADPVDWEVQSLYQRGNQALVDGKHQVAEAEFRKVLEKDANHLAAMTKLARALEGRAGTEPSLRTRLLDDALGLLDKATRIDPRSRVVYSELASVARKAGKPERAITALRQLLQLDSADSASRVALAEVFEQQGQIAEAVRVLEEGLERDLGQVRLAHGRLLLRTQRTDEARQALQGIEACPKPGEDLVKPPPCPTAAYYEAQDELGALAVRQGRMDDARKIYLAMVAMFPEDYMVWELLAALDEKAGDFPAAEEKYRQSLAFDRVHMSVWRGLGRCLAAQGKRDDALFAYRKADHFLAKSPAQALELADELVGLGEPAWARSLLERGRILVQGEAGLERIFDQKLAELALPRAPASTDGGTGGGDLP